MQSEMKKPLKSTIILNTEDVEDAQDIGGNAGNKYIRVEMPFKSLMTEFFEVSDIEELIQEMFTHIKKRVENLRLPESGFTLEQITHLHIKLALTQGSSYIELPE